MCCTEKIEYNKKKKTFTYKEKDLIKREKFLKKIAELPQNKIVYIDESGIDKFISREYGWSIRGNKIHGETSGKRYARESFVAGIKSNKFIAPFCYQGTCDSNLFNAWLEKILLPSLSPGHIIVMDNAAFHKSQETRELIEKAKCQLLFLPPYSPDLNPIEKCWANFKSLVKKIIDKFDSLQGAIDYAFNVS